MTLPAQTIQVFHAFNGNPDNVYGLSDGWLEDNESWWDDYIATTVKRGIKYVSLHLPSGMPSPPMPWHQLQIFYSRGRISWLMTAIKRALDEHGIRVYIYMGSNESFGRLAAEIDDLIDIGFYGAILDHMAIPERYSDLIDLHHHYDEGHGFHIIGEPAPSCYPVPCMALARWYFAMDETRMALGNRNRYYVGVSGHKYARTGGTVLDYSVGLRILAINGAIPIIYGGPRDDRFYNAAVEAWS